MSTYEADPEADYTDYDEDDDSDDEDVTALRVAQLRQENATLRRQLGKVPAIERTAVAGLRSFAISEAYVRQNG